MATDSSNTNRYLLLGALGLGALLWRNSVQHEAARAELAQRTMRMGRNPSAREVSTDNTGGGDSMTHTAICYMGSGCWEFSKGKRPLKMNTAASITSIYNFDQLSSRLTDLPDVDYAVWFPDERKAIFFNKHSAAYRDVVDSPLIDDRKAITFIKIK